MAGKKKNSGARYKFTLITGYEVNGRFQKVGYMRMATREDIVTAQNDPRTKKNPQYNMIVLLSLIVENIGALEKITTDVIEALDRKDMQCLMETNHKMRRDEAKYH